MKKILQAFKKLFKRKEKEPVYYICDPERNRECAAATERLYSCWYLAKGPCKCTRHKKYAKTDKNGEPVIARPIDIWNDEYREYCLLHPEHEYDD